MSFEQPIQCRDTSLPVLAIFDFDDENGAELDRRGYEFGDFKDEIGNVTLTILRNSALGSNEITLGGGEQRSQD